MHSIIFISIPEAVGGKGKIGVIYFEIFFAKTFRFSEGFFVLTVLVVYGTIIMIAEAVLPLVCPVNV